MTEMITIPRDEYEVLRAAAEDLADIEAYDRAMAEREPGMPHEVLTRLIEGENPVRVLREWRGLSVSELARRTDVHRVQIHDIEAGRKTGSAKTLKALAGALGVSVDELI